MGKRGASGDNMKYETITTADNLTAEDIYKLLREGIRKYEDEYGFSPSKIVIDSSAFHILDVRIGKVMLQTGSLKFYGIPCEVKSLPDGQVAMIFR